MESNGDIVQLNKTEIQPENIVILIYTILIHFIPWCSQYNHQRGWHMGGVQKNGDKLCYIPTNRVKHV